MPAPLQNLSPRRAAIVLLALLVVLSAACSTEGGAATDAAQGDLGDAIPSDTLGPDAGGCLTTSQLFESRVWPFMGTTCFACHGDGGVGAMESDFDLIEVVEPADLEANLATVRAIATKLEDDTPIILLKPIGAIEHGGGPQLSDQSEEYAALTELVGRFETPAPCDPPVIDPTDPTPTSLSLTANTMSVRVGRVIPLSVTARNESGAVVALPEGLTLESSDAAVATVDAETLRVRGVSEGQAQITATLGALQSDALAVEVTPNEDFGTAAIRVSPTRLTLEPAQVSTLTVDIRDAEGVRILDPEIEWVSSDPAVVTIDVDGALTALVVGDAEITARFEGADSAPVPVSVTADSSYLGVDIITPYSDTSAVSTLRVEVDVQWFITGSPSDFGSPVTPDRAELLADGSPLLTLTPDLFGAVGQVDLTGLSEGAHQFEAEVEVAGQIIRSAPVTVVKQPAPDPGFWEDLGDPNAPTWERVYGQPSRTWFVDDALFTVTNQCGNQCSLRVYRYDEIDARWRGLEYSQRHFVESGGVLEERISARDNVDLAHYTGWGWPSTNAQHAHAAPEASTLAITWSNLDARTAFNTEDEPARYWNDCHVARWDDAAGYDGAGGWLLLSAEAPGWQDEPPHPDTLPAEINEQRFPSGVNATRTEDCTHPKIGIVGGAETVAHVSTPIPDNDWRLRLRDWNGSAWQDAGPELALPGGAVLHDMVVDSSDRPIIAVDHGGTDGRVFRLEDGAWQPLGTAPPTRALRLLDDGTLIAASVEGQDVSLHRFEDGTWTALGGPVDVVDWAEIRALDLFVDGDRVAVAWAEGPDGGDWNLFAGAWRVDTGVWEIVGGGAFEADPDGHAIDPHVVIDASGRLIVRYAIYNTTGDDLRDGAHAWIQLARRSISPVF